MEDAQILNMLGKMSERRINSKSFGELFQIDGLPLWYFLYPLVNSSFLPKPFMPLWKIEESIKKKMPPSSLDKLKFNLSAFAVKKGLIINEWIKLLISRRGKKDLERTRKKDALFIALTDQISEKNEKLEFLEIGNIVNLLKQGAKMEPLILVGDRFSKNSFFRLNRYSPLIYDYITPGVLDESKRLSHELHKKWNMLDEKSKTKLFTWRGKNYWKFFENDMNFLFSEELLSTFIKYYLAFKNVLEKHDIKVVYLTSFTNFYDLSVLGAVYKLNGKVVYSSHGYTRGTVGAWEFMKNVVFAAGGNEHKRDLIKSGIRKEKIFVTGFPFLDEIAGLKRAKTPKEKKTVALLTTIVVESKFIEKDRYFKLIRETLAQIKNIGEIGKVIIKLHPRERYKSRYESIAKSLGLKNIEVIQEPGKAPLYSVIRDSDLLVGFGSTAILEGLMAGKDAIHLEMLEARPVFEFKKATFCVKEIDKIGEAIKKVLTDENIRKKLRRERARYLHQAFYTMDGKAHRRVANLIASLVKER